MAVVMCQQCGTEVPGDPTYCPACGKCLRAFDLRPGQIFNRRYRIEKKLGRGGFGVVYLASDLESEERERVALKVLHAEFGDDPTYRPRFRREFEITKSFRHPCAAAVREFGATDENTLYFTMEYVEGQRLDHLLSTRGHFKPEEALSVFDHLLSVLVAAHRQSILHLDIKPANIILQPDPSRRHRVRLLDFGTAKLRAGTHAAMTGSFTLGTAEYMPPEQFTPGDLDETADLYSACAVLYHMLFGGPPCDTDSRMDILRQRLAGPPSVPENLPGRGQTPPFLAKVLREALVPRTARRFITARELREAVNSALAREAGPAFRRARATRSAAGRRGKG